MLSTGGRDARIDGRGSLFALGDIYSSLTLRSSITTPCSLSHSSLSHPQPGLSMLLSNYMLLYLGGFTANLFGMSLTLMFIHRCIKQRLVIPGASKDDVRIIKCRDSQPAWMELHLRGQSLLFHFKKFGCLSTKAAGGSGAAKRDNPFTFRCGMEPVSPADPPRTNQWNQAHL